MAESRIRRNGPLAASSALPARPANGRLRLVRRPRDQAQRLLAGDALLRDLLSLWVCRRLWMGSNFIDATRMPKKIKTVLIFVCRPDPCDLRQPAAPTRDGRTSDSRSPSAGDGDPAGAGGSVTAPSPPGRRLLMPARIPPASSFMLLKSLQS